MQLYNCILNGKFIQKIDTVKVFFEQGRVGLSSPISSFMPVSVDEYASVSRNISKYYWKCHNVLTMQGLSIRLVILHIQQPFQDVLSAKCARVLIMSYLYIQVLNRVLNMSKYDLICLINVWICLNMS